MQEVNGVVIEQIYDAGEGTIREGVKIVQSGNTYCLVADKDFSQGEFILDTRQCMHVPKQIDKIKIKINGIEYICNKQHTLQYQDYRYFGKSLCFINHACNPNTIFFLNKTRLDQVGYQLQECFATRNIKKGEQLTCNYFYCYYDGEEQEQFVCGCGFQRCYKQIKGFKYLSLQDKINLLPILSVEVRQIWLKQQSNIKIIEQQQFLNKLYLDKNNCYLTASKQFTIGQIVFDYKPLQIDQNSVIIIKKHDKYLKMQLSQLKQLNSMISNNRLEYVKFYTKRSSSPNIQTIKKGENKVGLCVKKIQVGQVLVEGQNQLDADLLDLEKHRKLIHQPENRNEKYDKID